MKDLYLATHLALGDQIICAGLVREFAKINKVHLFCKKRNEESIKFLYQDIDIELLIGNDSNWYFDAELFAKYRNKNIFIIGNPYLDRSNKTKKHFDYLFYQIANMPFKLRWENWKLIRNWKREKELQKKLKLNIYEPYIFLHEDINRNQIIDRKRLPNMNIIEAKNITNNIFDWLSIIEGATEIHCIDSCFACLIDCYSHWTQKLIIHRYAKPCDDLNTPSYQNIWRIIYV